MARRADRVLITAPFGRVVEVSPRGGRDTRGGVKIKTFYAMGTRKLDKDVNAFLERGDIDVIDVRYGPSIFYFSVCVLYREKAAV